LNKAAIHLVVEGSVSVCSQRTTLLWKSHTRRINYQVLWKGTVRLGPWRIAQAKLYHGRAVKIVGVVKVTTGPLA
jgi:hypothetical protein